MTEEYGHLPDGFFLSQQEIDDLRNSKKELTEYAKQRLRELMNNKTITAKVSDEDYQKVLDAFNNPQPYPDEFFEEAERREVANRELQKEEWERTNRSDRILQRYNQYHNLETSGLAWGIITPEHQQIIAFESLIDALRCEHLNQEYDKIAIADIEDLIEGLRNQANEYLKRIQELKGKKDD